MWRGVARPDRAAPKHRSDHQHRKTRRVPPPPACASGNHAVLGVRRRKRYCCGFGFPSRPVAARGTNLPWRAYRERETRELASATAERHERGNHECRHAGNTLQLAPPREVDLRTTCKRPGVVSTPPPTTYDQALPIDLVCVRVCVCVCSTPPMRPVTGPRPCVSCRARGCLCCLRTHSSIRSSCPCSF